MAYVNANLRVLEKSGGLDGTEPVSWVPKQVDYRQIVVEAADISRIQSHTPEDDAYDFIREDMMRFTRQTSLATRHHCGESDVGASSSRPSKGHGRGHGGDNSREHIAGPSSSYV